MKRFFAVILCIGVLFCSSFTFCNAASENIVIDLIDSYIKFDDVEQDAWYKEYIDYAYTFKIINGVTTNLMKPSANITRAQFVQILANIDGVNTANTTVATKFHDVPTGKWYSPAIKWASENGIVDGVSALKFAPDNNLTREQMCKMLISYVGYKKIVLDMGNNVVFKDDSDISYWAYDYVYDCQRAQLVEGSNGYFNPKKLATRAQVATIMSRFHRDYLFDGTLPNTKPVDYGDKYDFDKNPLINLKGNHNTTVLPSYDISNDGFVKDGTTLSDLKYKKLVMYISDNPLFSYKDSSGKFVNEFDWLKSLKNELGLTITYLHASHEYQVSKPLAAMNSGIQCDLVYANNVTWPSALTLSKDIGSLVDYEKSPGVCQKTADILKWGNTYRVIAPIGEVNVLWYNQKLGTDLGLSDPQLLFENNKWNWNSFKSLILSVPKKTTTGQDLAALAQWQSDNVHIWPMTNGNAPVENIPAFSSPSLANNFGDENVMQAWEFIADVCNNVNYPKNSDTAKNNAYKGLFNGRTYMSSTMAEYAYEKDFADGLKLRWVPFPKSTTPTGKNIASFRGYALLLPRVTAYPENEGIALKFAELWACRVTEALFDMYSTYEYFDFTDTEKRKLFDFVTKNVSFYMAANDFHGTRIFEDTNFYASLDGNAQYNVRTEATKAKPIIASHIIDQLKYALN